MGPSPQVAPVRVWGALSGSPIKFRLSASEGFVSWRDTKSGSWYVETLDGVFEQWARSEDLQTLLLRVSVAVLWEREGRLLGGAACPPQVVRAGPQAQTRGWLAVRAGVAVTVTVTVTLAHYSEGCLPWLL